MQKNLSRGFTLIELFIVTTIILILASLAYPVYTSTQERARATQDMSNLRQIGLAAQMYFNDNDGLIFSPTVTWMSLLKPKYLPAWKIFQSPFDKRPSSEVGDATTPVSYGLNGNTGIAGLAGEKVTNPSAFILFAPGQTSAATVLFSGSAGQGSPGVTVYKGSTVPGGNYASATPPHGTHSSRTRINALFMDSHSESMTWSRFINDSTTDTTDPDAQYRWAPYQPYP